MSAVGYQQPAVAWNGLTVTDLFCGAGGSSSGLVSAGYKVVIAANHWAKAIESHQLNHPETDHLSADISQVNPGYFPRTDILWASPECTNHSVANGVERQRAEDAMLFDLDGTRPLSDDAANRSRATMWDVPRFAENHRYKAIIIENVVDAFRWVPFQEWLAVMEAYGYEHQIVWLNSMHAQVGGLLAPQSRDRMYVVFWRKDLVSKRMPRPGHRQVDPADGVLRRARAGAGGAGVQEGRAVGAVPGAVRLPVPEVRCRRRAGMAARGIRDRLVNPG